jgi:hypothetical protein
MQGKANCCSLARVQLSVLHLGGGRAVCGPATSRSSSHRQLHRGSLNTSYAARAVLVFWDGLGEDGSEDLLVRFRVAVVCRRGVGGQVAAVIGAEVVIAIGEASSYTSGCLCRRDRWCHLCSRPPALWL